MYSLPFALFTRFQSEEAKINPLGKAIKRFAIGEEDSLVYFVNWIRKEIEKEPNPAPAEKESGPSSSEAKNKTSWLWVPLTSSVRNEGQAS